MSIRLSSPPARSFSPDTPRRRAAASVRNFIKTSAGRVLVCTIVCWTVAYFYCTHQFWRDPHSAFFDSSRAYEMHYTNHRRAEARRLIDTAEADWNLAPYQSSHDPVICAGIVTVKRKKTQYLNETVGSLLAGLTEEERSALSVQVLFADPKSSKHPDWDHRWLKLVDHWSGYDVSNKTLHQLHQWKKQNKIRAKAIHDYTYLLDQCLNTTTAPYIAIFEDDVVFADGWLSKTMSALAEIRRQPTPWLYLRLFYTDVMLGWDKEIDVWYTNPIFSIIFAMGFTYTGALALRAYCKRSRPDADIPALMVTTCIAVPAFVTLIYMIGRNSLMPYSGLQRMDYKGCCTQALIFPRSQVPALQSALLDQKPDQTDLLMEDYGNGAGLARYAITPPIAQHVGIFSSRGTKKKNSQKIWASRFESNHPKRLRKEHEGMAKWAIWRASDDGLT